MVLSIRPIYVRTVSSREVVSQQCYLWASYIYPTTMYLGFTDCNVSPHFIYWEEPEPLLFLVFLVLLEVFLVLLEVFLVLLELLHLMVLPQ